MSSQLRSAPWTFIFNRDIDSCGDEVSGLTMNIFANITHPGCYNFTELFTANSSCNPNSPGCDYDFLLPEPQTSTYDPMADYSKVFFNQGAGSEELALRMYEHGDCTKSDKPWFQWTGCERPLNSGCTELPFRVGSIEVGKAADLRKHGRRARCQIGATSGTATRGRPMQAGAVVLAVVFALILLG